MNNDIPTITEDESREGYKVVATKVSPETYKVLQRISDRTGIKIYKLIQSVTSCLVRYMDDRHSLDPQLQQIIQMFFDSMGDMKEKFNITDFTADRAIVDALFIVADRKGGKGKQSVMVTPFGDSAGFFPAMENWNVMQQLEAIINYIFPTWYKKLRLLGTSLGTRNIYDTIMHLIDDAASRTNPDADYIHELFGDNDRSEYGIKPVSVPYKRHNRRDINTLEGRHTNAPVDPEQLEAEIGSKPFGYEY